MTKLKIEKLLVTEADQDPNGYHKGNCKLCWARIGDPHKNSCDKQGEYFWKQAVPTCDLRSICRDSDKAYTQVFVIPDRYSHHKFLWIWVGQGFLDRPNREYGTYTLRAYLGRGATDFEHDSAHAFQMELYGVQFRHVMYNHTVLSAFIPSDATLDDFKVPLPGYDPFSVDPYLCKECPGEEHPIVPEGMYVPKGDPTQLDILRGKRVEIHFDYVRGQEGE